MPLPARLSPLLLALGLVTAAADTKEVVGVLGSSVLLDPELKVDPSKNEILWTFITRSILHHVPGHTSVEPNEQFKSRLQFNTSNGSLMVNGLKPSDQGEYTFIVGGRELRTIQLLLFDKLSEPSILTNTRSLGFTVQLTCGVSGDPHEYQWQKDGGEISQHHQLIDGNRTLVIPSASTGDCGMYTCVAFNPVSSIQANYTLILIGLSFEDVVIVAVSTVGLLISSASLLPAAVLLDHWKTLGALLGISVYCLSLSICNVAFFVVIYIAFSDWILIKGFSPLDVVVVVALITGLRLSSAFVNASTNAPQTRRSVQGLSTKDAVTVALSITVLALPLVILVTMVCLLQKNSDQGVK
ncbi:HEPACAM family member 2-like [Pristis pectinata]|uniref:HEPACAM family member 2-like n=1 Tax=Pristis pectinata TaxID=685728 RepID=UPI00223D45AE|nr:HEPACAM family member 2-like [Pristis pectinata]